MTTRSMGPRERAAETKRRRTREQVISATLDLYGTQLKGDFTREEIAAAAGVGVATVHNHFGPKYGVLRAAYERLISPVIDVAEKEFNEGLFSDSPVIVLTRYLHDVIDISNKHHALTVAMVRAYFEVPPEQREHLYYKWDEYLEEHLGYPIVRGARLIVGRSGLGDLREEFQVNGVSDSVLLYHCNELLLAIYHRPTGFTGFIEGRTTERDTQLEVLEKQLLRCIVPDEEFGPYVGDFPEGEDS